MGSKAASIGNALEQELASVQKNIEAVDKQKKELEQKKKSWKMNTKSWKMKYQEEKKKLIVFSFQIKETKYASVVFFFIPNNKKSCKSPNQRLRFFFCGI